MVDKYLWAPWRGAYILGKKEKGCVFCNRINRKSDKKDLIVYRGEKSIVILNRYPYNSAHAMIVPIKHTSSLDKLTKTEANEFFELTRLTVKVIKNVLNPDSMNIGMNLGRGSGAGIPSHLHMHIIPRWNGDTSFMPVIANTKVVSFALQDTYKILKRGFDAICPAEKSPKKRN